MLLCKYCVLIIIFFIIRINDAIVGNDKEHLIKNTTFLVLASEQRNKNISKIEDSCISQKKPNDGKLYCAAVVVLDICWNYTVANSTVRMPCPSIPGFDNSKFAEKTCLADGTWFLKENINKSEANYTNFDSCINHDLNYVTVVYIVGYTISIVALLMSLAIFFYFSQLSCARVTLHKNLFICYACNALTWSVLYLLSYNENFATGNTWLCQWIHISATYFATASYFWMFCEGLYLLINLIFAFNKGKFIMILCVITGWVIPAILTALYGIIRKIEENPQLCWTDTTKFIYITAVPILFVLAMNFIFVIIIFGFLLTKLRSSTSPDQRQGRTAAKALVILVPLLGIQYILTLVQPEHKLLSIIHHYCVAIMVSFQGLFMSIILCFTNYEVLIAIRRRISQHQLLQQSRPTENQNTCLIEYCDGKPKSTV